MNCAVDYPDYHWPDFEMTAGCTSLEYNCIHWISIDGEHTILSADAKGIHASGASIDEAINDFRSAIITRMADKQGGLYPGTSDFAFQEHRFKILEKEWKEDGVEIIQKNRITICIPLSVQ